MPGKTKRSPSNKIYFDAYRLGNKREKNKIRKLKKHIKKHANDQQALKRLNA